MSSTQLWYPWNLYNRQNKGFTSIQSVEPGNSWEYTLDVKYLQMRFQWDPVCQVWQDVSQGRRHYLNQILVQYPKS